MADHCRHCGETHGPTECRPALAIRLAEAIDAHIEDTQHLATMHLEIVDLRRQVTVLQMERKR